jgi:uncharacterized protein YjbI with pentapeptide repeats
MKLLTALGLTAALLLSAQPAVAGSMPTVRTKSVCLAELKAANKAKRAPRLKNCRFGAITLKNANFRNADLRGADFASYSKDGLRAVRGANLSGADFRGAKLAGTVFYWANLSGANFNNADLTKTKFTFPTCYSGAGINGCSAGRFWALPTDGDETTPAILVGANFSGLQLSHMVFAYADLTGADFRGTIVSEAPFYNANLTNADFRGASDISGSFAGANFTNTNFSGLLRSPLFHPVYAQYENVIWSNTTMPDGRICSLESSQLIDRFSCSSE